MPTLSTYQPEVGPVDVAVIGAGINGLAVAREAAARGMSVLLIDQDDVAAKTSAISTRLIHGGLKYLERLELGLVRESIRERNILLAQAPHLVRPYPMLIPFLRAQRRPGWLLACGLLLHDVLSLGKRLPRNRLVGRRHIRRRWPSLDASGLRWGGLFHDAHVPLTERLTVELAIEAHQCGAVVLTHAPVLEIVRAGERVTGLRYRDRADGALKEVSASVVVNAAGPWVEDVLSLAGLDERRIGPTKGSHCVVEPFAGAPETCVFFESLDARPMFVLPWTGRYMIGTTDLPYGGSLDDIVIDDAEVDYLLAAVNLLIPAAHLTADDVLWSYSGVRPLPYVDDLRDPASVSREHQVVVHRGTESGLVTIVGGKLTTHRALGEHVTDTLERLLGRRHRSSPTRHTPLPGAPRDEEEWAVARARLIETSTLNRDVAVRLVDTYGRISAEIEALVTQDPELAVVVDPDSGAIAAEIVHAVRSEGAHTLEDVMLRRTLIGINADVGLSAAPTVAEVLVDRCGWSREQAAEQIDAYRRSVSRFRPRALRTAPPSERP